MRLQNEQTKLPGHMKTYESFDFLRNVLKERLAVNGSLKDLQSTMLRPKHEKMLLKEIGLAHVPWNELTVGQLWDIPDLKVRARTRTRTQAHGQAHTHADAHAAQG